jgi:hypothetical protein
MDQSEFPDGRVGVAGGTFLPGPSLYRDISEILMSPDIIILVGAAIGCGLMFAATFTKL